MMDISRLEARLAELPLLGYFFLDPRELEFTQRVRWVCEHECPRFGQTWACPPGVGTVDHCSRKCRAYKNCLAIATITEISDIANIEEALATRGGHEALTDSVREFFREQGVDPYILSTESCALCPRCAYLDGLPCRYPEKMHPCLESHGINLIPTLESQGMDFQFGSNMVTWFSLLFF